MKATTEQQQFLPCQLHMKGRRSVIIGGGNVALWKAERLSSAGSDVNIISPEFLGDWDLLAVKKSQRGYEGVEDLKGAFLVVAATNDQVLNKRITEDAQAIGILALCCDDTELSDLSFPATFRQGALTVSFSTDGISPTYAARLRDEAAFHYGPAHARCLEAIQQAKQSPAIQNLPRPQRQAATRALAQEMAEKHLINKDLVPKGSVVLLGAGPGDPELITIKAVERLRAADVIVHDALANIELLDRYAPHARRVDAGKHKGCCAMTQDQINETLVTLAKENLRVVRLKGGDPCLFGRAGEEIRTLQAENIPFEVVPGIPSLCSVPMSAGIPVTDRDFGRSVGAFSLHKRDGRGPGSDEYDRMAKGPDTLVLFMGRTMLRQACLELIARGRPKDLPAAMIINGTLPHQEVITGTLSTLPDLAEKARDKGPGLIVVGEVVTLRQEASCPV